MNYKDKSKFYINSKVAMHIGHSVSLEHECAKTGACFILTDTAGVRVAFNPCDNPSDAWPIIVDNEISIEFHSDRLKACKAIDTKHGVEFINSYDKDKRALLAAMICFLKIKDTENE